MRVAHEEIFGPVTAVIEFADEEEAIADRQRHPLRARRSGLDARRQARPSRRERLRAGTVWINNYRVWNWLTPFGGYKQSGYGRENGIDVMAHYTQTKSIWVDLQDDAAGLVRRLMAAAIRASA